MNRDAVLHTVAGASKWHVNVGGDSGNGGGDHSRTGGGGSHEGDNGDGGGGGDREQRTACSRER